MCVEQKRRLASLTENVEVGRGFVVSTLAAWGFDRPDTGDAVDDVLLIASELLTNGITASPGGVTLGLVGHRDHLEVSVTDGSAQAARRGDPGIDAESGRGLMIVGAISTEWGQEPTPEGGKRVWSRVAVAAAPGTLRDSCRLGAWAPAR
ncbi:MAG TPA: ATP-binding protein [Acidimicrobiales bacterium]|nr:ATP-binding protein [Acidimicrobiales bacterium]